jgi:hypothetical protein
MAPENAQIASERRWWAGGYSRWVMIGRWKSRLTAQFLTKLLFPARKKAQIPSDEGL